MSYLVSHAARAWEDLEARIALRRHHPHPNPPPGPVGPTHSTFVTVRLVNHSTVVTDADIAATAVDLQTQVSHDFAPAWLIDATIVAGGSEQPGEWVLLIEDDATVTGALGFHEEVDGVITGHVFARAAAGYRVPWSSVASHELLEMLGDPRTVLAGIDDPNGDGKSGRIYLAEACDAVEQSTYPVGQTVVSDFVLPAWWDATSAGPFDHLGLVHAPYELEAGGSYIGLIDFTSAQGWQQQTARKAPAVPATASASPLPLPTLERALAEALEAAEALLAGSPSHPLIHCAAALRVAGDWLADWREQAALKEHAP